MMRDPSTGSGQSASGLQYFLTDNLGSTVAITDSNGTLTSQQRYLPFGGTRTNVTTPNSPGTDFGYTGQRQLDAGMGGLMDYKARFYSPMLGRFVQPDTIIPGGPQGLNRSSYVANNPVNFNDPTGHKECDYKCQITYERADPNYEHYGEGLSCWGPEDCYGIKHGSVVSRALKGDTAAIVDAIMPTDYGLRVQGEVVTKNILPGWMPSSGTVGVQETFNRNDGNLVFSVDGSLENGPTLSPQFPIGGSFTAGGVLGWFSSDLKQSTSGQSAIVSGTLAGGRAASAAVTTLANLQADRKYGAVPVTVYAGTGYGAGYASAGGGIVFSKPLVTVNIYQMLGIKP